MKIHRLSFLALAFFLIPGLQAATQDVKLPAELQKRVGSVNEQLKKKLSADDYAELLKGEIMWPGDSGSLLKKLAEVQQALDDDDIFPRAYIVSQGIEDVQFEQRLQNQQDPILYADSSWVITRANGKGKFSSVYTFWNTRTGLPEMKLNLPGNVYCPTPTNVPGVYALQLTQNRRASEDYFTWHGLPCTLCLVNPEQKSFATRYSAIGETSSACPDPFSYYKGVTEIKTPYYVDFSRELISLEQTGSLAISEKIAKRKEIQARYEGVKAQYDKSAALSFIGTGAHSMFPLEIEQTAAFRLPREPFFAIAGDTSGKTASLTFSTDGTRYVSLDFDTMSRTITYSPEAIGKKVTYNIEGTPAADAELAIINNLKLKLSPLPSRPGFGIEVILDNISVSAPSPDCSFTIFACNTGNYAWNVYEDAVIDEVLGIRKTDGQIFFFNPNSVPLNKQTKMQPQNRVVDKSENGMIRGGSGMIQFAGRYRLMCVLHSNEKVSEVLICKQIDRNKELYSILSINEKKSEFSVLRRWESTVYRLAPIWIERKKWLLQPTSDNSYDIVQMATGKEPQKLATLFISPVQDGYAVVLPDGRYAGSPGCERFLRVANKGLSVFAPWRNRPADVLTALGGNPDDIAALRETTKRWLKKQGFDADNMPADPILADLPMASVTLPALYSSKSSLPVNVALRAGARAISKLELRVDGILQPAPKVNVAPRANGKAQVQVSLASGQNNIEITPIDAAGISGDSVKFRVIGPGDADKSDLYVVAMGVSAYDDEEIALQYAAKDATDIINCFRTYGNGSQKHVLLLTDKQVKDERVIAQISSFIRKAKPNDRVVMYLAGHGMLDDQLQYFYAPAGFDVEDIPGTGISMDVIRDCLQSTPARRRLLLLDTCHAGTLGEAGQDKLAASGVPLPHGVQAVQTRGMKVKKVKTADKPEKEVLNDVQKKRYIEDFFSMDAQMRGINVLAASAGAEFAQESGKWKNGVFTSSLMRAMSRRAPVDANADGLLSVEEMLHYVSGDVSTLTSHAQKPSVVSAEDTRGFFLSSDLAWYVHRKDWSGLQAAANAEIDVNEGAYPNTEGIICKALELGAPESALKALLDNGANVNRAQTILLRGEKLQEIQQTPRMLITQDNSYIDFDGRKIDFCSKYGYPVLALRRLFQPYYAKHKAQFAPPAATKSNSTTKPNSTTPAEKPARKRIKSRLYR